MARFDQGWVKVWRLSSHSDLIGNVYLWGIWHWLLLAATWKPSKILWNGQQRELPPGSVVFGLEEISKSWKCSRSTVSTWLKYLQKTGRVVYEPSKRGCLITICNWELYQSQDDAVCTEREQEADKSRIQPVHEVALSEEVKNLKKKEQILASALVAEKKPLESLDLEGCYQAWLDTLSHFKAGRRNLLAEEQTQIVRAVQRCGSDSAVKFALIGARYEPKTEKFDPAHFLKLSRILGPEHFNRFINLGIQAEHRLARTE